MSQSNWEKTKYLPISSFVLVSIVFAILMYWTIKMFLNLKQMQKFKQQDVIFYENTTKFRCLIGGMLVTIVFYGLNLLFFLFYLIWINQTFSPWQSGIYITLETLALLFLISGICLLIWTTKVDNSIIIVVKNHKLILLTETILLTEIVKVFHDGKRKYLYLNWKDPKTKGNIDQVKIRYHYEIKDLFLSLNLPTNFD